jgi:hypothetical protein
MSDGAEGAPGAGPSHHAVEAGVAVAMGLFALVVVAGSTQAGIGWGAEGPKAGFFPFYVGLVILVSSAVNFIAAMSARSDRLFADWGQLRLVMSVLAPTTVYVALVPLIGIYVASILLIAVFMRWLGGYGWPLIASIALGVPIAFFIVFERWFLVPLPKGPIENLLGF